MTALEFLSNLLVEEFNVDPSEVVPEATLTGLGLDSLSTVELVRELEDEFRIKLSSSTHPTSRVQLRIKLSSEQADFSTLGEAAAIADGLIQARHG